MSRGNRQKTTQVAANIETVGPEPSNQQSNAPSGRRAGRPAGFTQQLEDISPASPSPGEHTDSSDNEEAEVAGSERNGWRNSTSLPVRALHVNSEQMDPTARLVEALEKTLNTVREASLSEGNSRLVNRLTTAKDLPVFSGNPLEWLHFKEAYKLSSELGGYSDRENMARLFKALKGEAREVVNTLLATSRDADVVIRTLELHYGNKKTVAEKIVSDLKILPSIESGKVTLTQFATKFKNAIIAFKTLELTGYLHSPELSRIVGNKIPSALKYAYNRYAAGASNEKSELEKLSDFLYAEAELAAAAGVFDVDVTGSVPIQSASNAKKNTRRAQAGAVYAANHVSDPKQGQVEISRGKNRVCVICKRENHAPSTCALFTREPLDKRWFLARKYRLCYNCLKFGHAKDVCRNVKCRLCGKPHHGLLHRENSDSTHSNKQQNFSPNKQLTAECVHVANSSDSQS